MTRTETAPVEETARAPGAEQMNIVVIGHVDHGKSTLIGRLLADTDSLPEGRLEQVKAECRRTSKPFEYAFLLDALRDERDQGITIDSARCFFKSARREYIIIDAPGHIEFLKNMISGAARAEAGLLVIDALEGVQENSRRHGYLLSLLGIRQVAVCVNKMDAVGYDRAVFEGIRHEYERFLERVGLRPTAYVPISAREGDNIVGPSPNTPWYDGASALELLDGFHKEPSPVDKPFRMPVQDIYKFTAFGDDRRIVAGRVETGVVHAGDEVAFLPSGKRSRVAAVEGFNVPPTDSARAGQSTGFTLEEQIYIRPGEVMVRADQRQPDCGTRLRVNLVWLGSRPFIRNKRYKLKLGTSRVPAWLSEVHNVMDASDLTTDANRQQVERHDVAECTLETLKPVACDPAADLPRTGRFVIIDNYEIAGGGIVLESLGQEHRVLREHVQHRELAWERTAITPQLRAAQYGQHSALVVISGGRGTPGTHLARALEADLFQRGRLVYYLGLGNTQLGIDADLLDAGERDEFLRRLGEVAHLFTDAGMILVTTVPDLDDYELDLLQELNRPNEIVHVHIGEDTFVERTPDLHLEDVGDEPVAVARINDLLKRRKYILEYNL